MCSNLPLLLERALFEAEQGNRTLARSLFEKGCKGQKAPHAPLLQAWAQFEERVGNTEKAERLYSQYQDILRRGKTVADANGAANSDFAEAAH